MAKIAIKSENITPYGGIFYVMGEFKRTSKLSASPAFLASPSPCFASPACFAPAGIASLGRGPLAAAGSLTPSGVRLKAPASPGLFRGTRIGKIEKF